MPRPTQLRRSDFAAFDTITTRWADNDLYGHVNNAIHYQYFDTAVNGWLLKQGILDFGGTPSVFLVVETGCTYFAELAYPDIITAGFRVKHLGKTSVTYEIGLFRNEVQETAAQGHFVHVNVGRESRKPTPISETNRAKLAGLIVDQSAAS